MKTITETTTNNNYQFNESLSLNFNILIAFFLLFNSYISSNYAFATENNILDIEKALGIYGQQSSDSSGINSLLEELKREQADEQYGKNSGNHHDPDNLESSDIRNTDSEGVSNLSLVQTSQAELIVLNKITAKSVRKTLDLGEVYFFGNLSIEVHKCVKNSDPLTAHNLMLMTIFDNKLDEDNLSVFHGWLISSNPSISTLEHPVYEVIAVQCQEPASM